MTKNQANAKEHTEAELLLFENYLLLSSNLSPKNSRGYSKKYAKTSASVLMRLLMTMKLSLYMNSNILNVKYKMYNDGYMY